MKKQKVIIVLISLCVFLIVHNNHVPSQSYKEPPPTKVQLEAFRSAKTVRILVEQSYQDDQDTVLKDVSLPLEDVVEKFLKFIGLQVLNPDAKNYDLEIKIKTLGTTTVRDGKVLYPGATITGVISFEISDIPIYACDIRTSGSVIPETISESLEAYQNPFSVEEVVNGLLYGFEDEMFRVIGKIYGISAITARLNDKDAANRMYAVKSLGHLYSVDPQVVQPLLTALKDENKDVRAAAARALGYIGDPRAVEPLIRSPGR